MNSLLNGERKARENFHAIRFTFYSSCAIALKVEKQITGLIQIFEQAKYGFLTFECSDVAWVGRAYRRKEKENNAGFFHIIYIS
jgi:hypothetical protein